MSFEEDILNRIVPTEEDEKRIKDTADRLVATVHKYMDEHRIKAELKLVGSYSKGTYLSNPDLDLFIMFPPGTSREELETTGLKIGEDVLHGTRMYAEHPYTSAVFEGVDVDLVPNIHIESTDKLETAVDRTPFHTMYVLGHLKEGQANQIRLLKKFMKGIGAYGAEPNARGFSGYLCELLVLKYGTFDGVLQAAATTWKNGMQITLEKAAVRLESALVFYDPVDGKRNVASAVHADTMAKFVLAARDYLAQPSESFFFPNERRLLTDDEVCRLSKGIDIVCLSFDSPDTIKDNLYAQVWKTVYAVKSKLDSFGFGTYRFAHRVSDGKMLLAFAVMTAKLPDTFKHAGPPVWAKNSENFLEKWNSEPGVKPFVEDGRWYVIAPRQYTDITDMLSKEIDRAGLGKDVDTASMRIFTGIAALTFDRETVSELLDPTPVWKF